MMRKGYLLLAVFLLVIPGISQADTIIYSGSLVNAYSGTYTLEVTDDGDANPDTYHATLSVLTNTVSNAYIDWFQVHFDTPASDITGSIIGTNITTATATGTWVEGAGQDVFNFGGTFPDGVAMTGGFEQGILNDGSIVETGGFLLNGNLYSWAFDFTSDAPILGELSGDPNLQAGFYGSGVNGHPRLSQTFSVPEASALLLLGTGLVGLVSWRRKKRFE
jgi:hypothetical protein